MLKLNSEDTMLRVKSRAQSKTAVIRFFLDHILDNCDTGLYLDIRKYPVHI